MQRDRVQRILDLMRHAAGDAADRRQTRSHVELRRHAFQQLFNVVLHRGGFLARAAELLAQQVQLALDRREFLGQRRASPRFRRNCPARCDRWFVRSAGPAAAASWSPVAVSTSETSSAPPETIATPFHFRHRALRNSTLEVTT